VFFRAAPTRGASALAEFLARLEAEHGDPVAALDHLTLAKFTRCPTGVKCSQVQLQSGSAKYAPTRNDAIVVDAETPCDLVCNGGRGMSQRRNGVP
jgi:hypothetical protein